MVQNRICEKGYGTEKGLTAEGSKTSSESKMITRVTFVQKCQKRCQAWFLKKELKRSGSSMSAIIVFWKKCVQVT